MYSIGRKLDGNNWHPGSLFTPDIDRRRVIEYGKMKASNNFRHPQISNDRPPSHELVPRLPPASMFRSQPEI